MPVLESERAPMPRSALRYRSIAAADDQARPAPRPSQQTSGTRRVVAPAAPDDLEQEARATRRSPAATPSPHPRRQLHLHPLFFLGCGLLVASLLWIGMTQVLSWGNNELNSLKYGNPRTFQIDAVVGQGDSVQHPSHFVAINLHGIVTILDFPAGDPEHMRMLGSSPVLGPNAEQAVVTLRFIDVNHNGKPDMLINVDGVQSVLVNDRGTFRLPTTEEQYQILQQLQQQPSSS